MKAEDLDHIYQKRIEELDEVPDLHWDDQAVWHKVAPKINTNWSNLGTWTFSCLLGISALIAVLIFYRPNEPLAHIPQASEYAIPRNTDLKPVPSVTATAPKKRPKQVLQMDPVPSIIEKRPYVHFYTRKKTWQLIEPKLNPKRYSNTIETIPLSHTKSYQLPVQKILNLHIDNALNFKNIGQLWNAVRDQGTNFRYNYVYKPDPAAHIRMPFQKEDGRTFRLNDSQNK